MRKRLLLVAGFVGLLAASSMVFAQFAGWRFDAGLLSIQVHVKGTFQVGLVLGGDMERVDLTVTLWRDGFFEWIIMSDGLPCDGSTKGADQMKARAVALGIPENRILIEDNAVNTIGNFYYAKTEFLIPNGWTNVAVITSDYHVPRSDLIAKNILGADYGFTFYSLLTEEGPALEAAIARERSLYVWHYLFFLFVPDSDHELAKWFAGVWGYPIGCAN